MKGSVSILNKTKGTLPRVPFLRMKNAVLGNAYELSLVFVDDAEARDISLRTKNKDYIPNVLSFPLAPDQGEVFICPAEALRQGFSIAYLFIHALCHLKGMEHSATMERIEAKFRKEFGV